MKENLSFFYSKNRIFKIIMMTYMQVISHIHMIHPHYLKVDNYLRNNQSDNPLQDRYIYSWYVCQFTPHLLNFSHWVSSQKKKKQTEQVSTWYIAKHYFSIFSISLILHKDLLAFPLLDLYHSYWDTMEFWVLSSTWPRNMDQ